MIDPKFKKNESRNLTDNVSVDFPRKIGNFIFVKEFYPDKKVRHFDFAIYENSAGKRAIAKQWNKSHGRIDYHWLVNEINVYREIHRVRADNPQIDQKYPNIHIPDLLEVVNQKDRLIMLIEKIDGQSIKTITLERQIAVFQNVIEYIAFLGGKIDSSAKKVLIKRSMWHVAAIFPFIFTLAIINHPKKFLSFLRGGIAFSINILRTLNQREMVLVHRDLYLDHVIIRGEDIWIIDFQLSVIANPAFEIVGLISDLWSDINFRSAFQNDRVMGVIKKDKNKFYAYKTLSIYTAFYNIGAVKVMTSDQVFSYLDYSLGLKF